MPEIWSLKVEKLKVQLLNPHSVVAGWVQTKIRGAHAANDNNYVTLVSFHTCES